MTRFRRSVRLFFLLGFALFTGSRGFAQAKPPMLSSMLGEEVIPSAVVGYQVRQYLVNHAAPPPLATSAAQWTAEASRLRRHLLHDVVFHGWPKEWIDSPPKFEDLGTIEAGEGYRLRKLRYEIVPGFQSTAILYEPASMQGKLPAVLNFDGHVGQVGKATEAKQKRCINFAKHGILALSLEWLSMGELASPENQHWFEAHLDLVGMNGLGLFYLAMRRGLDYLYDHPHVDRSRLALTGHSGGGWQTIVLSSLDERVTVAVPVAGFNSVRTKVEVKAHGDLGDLEQNATDLLDGQDYTHLAAMMAPRPTLLVYNAEDNCCFRAPVVKPLIFDGIKPFFTLYGKKNEFEWHENLDPGDHNYQLDNRLQLYRFVSEHFNLPPITSEIPVGQEIKSYDELVVGLPKDNLTFLGLARRTAQGIRREPVPVDAAARTAWADSQRRVLAKVTRYKPVSLNSAWTITDTKHLGLESQSYLFQMSDGLSASGVWLKGIASPDNGPVTIVLNDNGKKAAAVEVADRMDRDERVLALDLLFTGDAWKNLEIPVASQYAQILSSLGDRPIGMQAAQLIEVVHWCQKIGGVRKVRLEVTGIRNQVAALIAAALDPNLFSAVVVHEWMASLGYLLDVPVTYRKAPELFCLDLYRNFDLDRLTAMAAPVKVVVEKYVQSPTKN